MCRLCSLGPFSTEWKMTVKYICLEVSHLTLTPPSQTFKRRPHLNTPCEWLLAGGNREFFQLDTNFEQFSWGFDTETYGWTQYDVLMNVSNRPSWGEYAEIPEHGLAFYLNGAIGSMSSFQDWSGNSASRTLQGMIVLDLVHHKASFSPNSTTPSLLTYEFLGQKHIH